MRLDKLNATTCASMSKIRLTEKEAETYQSQVQDLFAWVKQISEVDTTSVQEDGALQAAYLRPDEPVIDEALANTLVSAFSEQEGHCAKVKKVL